MKRTHLQRILALSLSAALLFAAPLNAGAAAAGKAPAAAAVRTAELGTALQGPGADIKPGESLTDVTEEEALAFERGLSIETLDAEKGSVDFAAKAKQKAQSLVSLYQGNSVQYAIMQNGELLLSDAVGIDDPEKKTKVTTDSIYCVASISKMFTTAAVLQLVEEKKIDLDAPVVTYVPDFTMADERYKDITVRMLLNHSSGLLGGDLSNALLYGDNDTYYHDHLLEKLSGEHLKADPGAYSVYCNDGFLLAEIVVEYVSGKSFSEYLQEKVFDPLELSSTRTAVQLSEQDPVAGAYLTKKSPKLPIEYLNAIGTGGIYSNAENLCRFGMTFTKNQGKLLSGDSVAATMVQEGRKGQWCEEYTGMLDYGLGWDSVAVYPFADYGITAVEKGGDSLNYHGELVVLPDENLSVAVLSSGLSGTHDEIFAQYLAKELLKEQGTLTEEKINAVASAYTVDKQRVPDELKIYEGYYTSMSEGYRIKLTKTGLTMVSLAQPDAELKFTYSGDGLFVYAGGVQALKFMTQNGKKYVMLGAYTNLPGIGTSYLYYYFGQKTASKKLSKSVSQAWEKRDDKAYFYVSEKYSSMYYELGAIASGVDMDMCQPGYFYNDRIVDADNAVEFIDVPMQVSRSARNYGFVRDANGAEYLEVGGIRAICEDSIKNLSAKNSFKVRLNSKTGDAKWYKISSKNAGRTITVKVPDLKGATVAVYDKDGNVKLNSYVSGKTSVKLPKNGYIVFAGDKGASFSVKIK